MDLKSTYLAMGISPEVYDYCLEKEKLLSGRFSEIDRIFEFNQLKVLKAMQDCKVSEACLVETTGYGYNDIGRDRLEEVYARIFRTEDALVRSQIVCGTHALTVALFGNTRPGDEIFSPVGLPYDTLLEVLGVNEAQGSLKEYGVSFAYCDIKEDGSFDWEAIRKGINERTALVTIQRSRGYSQRQTLSIGEIKELIAFIRSVKPEVTIMVDNCYGEFIEDMEPSEVGADMIVGSLIKNPGGGIAPVGGYVAGTSRCVKNAAARLTAPGLYKELGPSLGNNRLLYQGLFMAPSVAASAEKGAILLSAVYEGAGFSCTPGPFDQRDDIIEAVTFHDPKYVISFCRGVQRAASVDSFIRPEPTPTPGYEHDIIMAAGCFISGSSIELSADGPLREPYTVYFQGGLTYFHSKFGVMMSLQQLIDDGLFDIRKLS